jgi:hypothetical protein
MRFFSGQRRMVEFFEISMKADHWRFTGADVTIRCPFFG